MFCYRRRGHNETDEPFATQPLMYKEITSKDSVTDLYFKKLLSKGIVEEDKYKEFKKNYRSHMEKGETVSRITCYRS